MLQINENKYRIVSNGETYTLAQKKSRQDLISAYFTGNTTWIVPEDGTYTVYLKSGGSYRRGSEADSYWDGTEKTEEVVLKKGQSINVVIGTGINRASQRPEEAKTTFGTVEVYGLTNVAMTWTEWTNSGQGKGFVTVVTIKEVME